MTEECSNCKFVGIHSNGMLNVYVCRKKSPPWHPVTPEEYCGDYVKKEKVQGRQK